MMKKLKMITIGLLSLAALASTAIAYGYGRGEGCGPGMMTWGGGWGMGVGMIMMAVFWIIVITALVFFVRWLVRSMNKSQTSHGGGYGVESPLDILKKRYAKGEIDKQEFEQRKKDIE